MTKNIKYLTPWLQDILAEFHSHPSERTLKEMLASPLPEKIKSALRDAYKRWIDNMMTGAPRIHRIENDRNTHE